MERSAVSPQGCCAREYLRPKRRCPTFSASACAASGGACPTDSCRDDALDEEERHLLLVWLGNAPGRRSHWRAWCDGLSDSIWGWPRGSAASTTFRPRHQGQTLRPLTRRGLGHGLVVF